MSDNLGCAFVDVATSDSNGNPLGAKIVFYETNTIPTAERRTEGESEREKMTFEIGCDLRRDVHRWATREKGQSKGDSLTKAELVQMLPMTL